MLHDQAGKRINCPLLLWPCLNLPFTLDDFCFQNISIFPPPKFSPCPLLSSFPDPFCQTFPFNVLPLSPVSLIHRQHMERVPTGFALVQENQQPLFLIDFLLPRFFFWGLLYVFIKVLTFWDLLRKITNSCKNSESR